MIKVMKNSAFIILIILLLISFFACSTSKGSLFKDTHDSDKKRADPGRINISENEERYYPDDDTYKEEEGLFISSYPAGADVYLDYMYEGKTPLFIPGLETRNYSVRLIYPGYEQYEDWIYYPGGHMSLGISLNPVTGYLSVTVTPLDAKISIDDQNIIMKTTRLPVGTHILSAKKFGYKEYKEIVTISEDQTISREIILEKEEFSISGLNISRKVFNPGNPGALGSIDISFYVTSNGSADIKVTDVSGKEVYSYTIPDFQTWYQYCIWDGRNENNIICQDGEYIIKIDAISKEDEIIHSLTASVRIDSTVTITYRSMWNGMAGLMYSATADVLPLFSFQIATIINTHFEQSGNQIILRAPSLFGIRFGMGNNCEIDFFTSIIFTDAEYYPFIGGAGIKYQFLKTNGLLRIESALYAKAAYHYGTGADTYSNFTGISAGIPFAMIAGPLSVIINPEVIVSPFSVTYTSDYDDNPKVRVWGYGRCGILFDAGFLVTGVSVALRTTSFTDLAPFGINYPLLGAYELHYMLPDSFLFVSFDAAVEFESLNSYYIMGGIGLGLIY